MGYALTILRSESARYQPAPAPAAADRRRAARLVQPAASQHAVPGARPDRLHRDDHRGRVDGAVDRPREGARHDGAGADGAARRRVVRASARRFPISSSRWCRRWASSSSRWCCSDCRCAGRGCCCCSPLSLFLVGALGLGLLISSVADTQQVAFQLAMLASFLPTLMLSGFIFPIASMPAFLQAVTYVVPARYFLIALRAIVLKGVGIRCSGPISSRLDLRRRSSDAASSLRRQWLSRTSGGRRRTSGRARADMKLQPCDASASWCGRS